MERDSPSSTLAAQEGPATVETSEHTDRWRKPTDDELRLNPNMRRDVPIPATPPCLKSVGSKIPATPEAK